MRLTIILLVCGILLSFTSPARAEIYQAQGEMVGEVTMTSAILQSRLTAVPQIVEGQVPGAAGVARFEYAENADFEPSQSSDWIEAKPEQDYIVKTVLTGLKPATQYHYRLIFGENPDEARIGPTATFRTLPGAEGTEPVRFVVVTGMHYGRFHGLKRGYRGPNPDRAEGFPALAVMAEMDLDFFVGTGDNVYYDHDQAAETLPEMRRKWQEQFAQPRFHELFQKVPTYWEKDDHDHRYNDSDATGDKLPGHEMGLALFREQVPVVDPDEPEAKTYRTHRINRDLQIWLVEGRDYRSPNRMADGPEKTIWGAEQLAWLKQSLLGSDAKFKLLISPTPMVGPDDGYKSDNHVNQKGFRHEGRAFFRWVTENNLHNSGFYVVCGDRHWQYHSLDPSGVEEFSTGALVDANSRLGRSPGDPKSTDPDAEINQLYTQDKPSGGFLQITITPDPDSKKGKAEFTFFDERGRKLYETVKTR